MPQKTYHNTLFKPVPKRAFHRKCLDLRNKTGFARGRLGASYFEQGIDRELPDASTVAALGEGLLGHFLAIFINS